MNNDAVIDREQAELYDRQIRLWGVEAQRRLQGSKVLVCGIRGLNLEVAKNLVLAGLNLVIQDSSNIFADDLSANFFFTNEDIGSKRADVACARIQDLNHYATVQSELRPLSELDDNFFNSFSVILLSDCLEEQALRINKLCHNNKSSFYWTESFGLEGLFLIDLGDSFEYKNDSEKNLTIEKISYPTLLDVLSKPWSQSVTKFSPLSITFIKFRIISIFRTINNGKYPNINDLQTIKTLTTDLLVQHALEPNLLSDNEIESICITSTLLNMSVCAVIGGFLAQEVIKATSHVGKPMMNVFVFSAIDCIGRTISIL
eukprot:gene7354-15011_t